MLFILFLVISVTAFAQETVSLKTVLQDRVEAEKKERKLKFGLSWNQYWGTIKGNSLPERYFAKPCVGANLRIEYYPLSFIGIGAGFGVQQRGAGIYNEDKFGGSFTRPWEPNYDPDSTYRERLRMNTIEVPITLLLKYPKDVIKGVKVSGAVGIVWFRNDYVKNFFHKPEDGFHTITDVTQQYIRNDLGFQGSFGVDIDVAKLSTFQVHLVYTKGTKNTFRDSNFNGNVETYGFRVAWLY